MAADPRPALCTLTPPICVLAAADYWGAGGLTCQEQWCLRSLGVSQCRQMGGHGEQDGVGGSERVSLIQFSTEIVTDTAH